MQRSWEPLTAGILDIVSGAGMLFACFWLVLAGGVTGIAGNVPNWVPVLLVGLAIPFALIAIISVVGGILAIKRKSWGWALAGSITAVFCSVLLGILAIVLVALSRNEFS